MTVLDPRSGGAVAGFVRSRSGGLFLGVGATVCLGCVGSTLLVLAGSGWGGSPRWFGPDTPLSVTRVAARVSYAASVGGLLSLVAGWLLTGLLVRRGVAGVRAVTVAAVAALPLLAGPPLFSSDARTYVAIGQLVDTGGDPYTQGWGALGRADYLGRAGGFWYSTASPYSPGALRLLQAAARLGGGDLDRGALVLRVVAVLGVAVTGVLVLRIAQRVGASAAAALWLAVANPVVLLGGVSGAHLDAVVAPLVLGAAALVIARRPILAGLLLGLAAQMKITALVVVVVAVTWALLRDRNRAQIRVALMMLAATVGSFVVVSLACGLGWGWVSSLSVPGSANTTSTPLDALGDLAYRAGFVGRVGTQAVSGASGALQGAALVVAAALCLLIVVGLRQVEFVEATGWVAAVVLLLSGSFWSWYLIIPLALVAVAPPRRGLALSRAGLAVLGLVTFAGARPGGAPPRFTIGGTADLAFLAAYGCGVVLVLVGLLRGRQPRRRRNHLEAGPAPSGALG